MRGDCGATLLFGKHPTLVAACHGRGQLGYRSGLQLSDWEITRLPAEDTARRRHIPYGLRRPCQLCFSDATSPGDCQVPSCAFPVHVPRHPTQTSQQACSGFILTSNIRQSIQSLGFRIRGTLNRRSPPFQTCVRQTRINCSQSGCQRKPM